MRGVRLPIWKLALFAALGLGASCGTPTFIVQEYAGPVRAAETIAIIRVDGSGTVQLLSLDGQATDVRVTPDARLHIEVLPGNHTLWVQSLVADVPAQSLVFRAEAGKVYRVEFAGATTAGPPSPHVYEVDRDSNALRADVTARQAPADVAAPPRPARVATPPARVLVEPATPTSLPPDARAPAEMDVPADAGTLAP